MPVGCIIVYRGEIIGRGANASNAKKSAIKHAEFLAIDEVNRAKWPMGTLSRSTLYVTLEPCIMCAAALRIARLGRVVYGACNDRFGNGVFLFLVFY